MSDTIQCLREQMEGDIKFDGINDVDMWIDDVCLANFTMAVEEEEKWA